MFSRSLLPYIQMLAGKYPVVTILGPRQSGKTTLVKQAFPHLPYVNLEDLEHRALAIDDPKSFILKYPHGAIFDEIQRVPSLLCCIQVKVDEVDQKGMYILTGSHQLDLHASISQSLAGRTSVVKLLPLSLKELRENKVAASVDEVILSGGYPRIYRDQLPLQNAFNSYVQTYVERDVRSIINLKDVLLFEKFIKLLSARVGQIVNYASLAVDVGVSSMTVKEWLSVLEASYLVFRLQPFYENFGKRMIKSPKIYFSDTGLLCHLLGIQTINDLRDDSLYGHIFENFTILELFKYGYNSGRDPKFYFFRDTNGHEVDLIMQKGSNLIPIEIKSSRTYSTAFLEGLEFFHRTAEKKAKSGFVVYQGEASQKIKEFYLYNVEKATDITGL